MSINLNEDRMNITNDSLASHVGDDLFVISFWSTILVYALITNTLTVIGIFRSQSMRAACSYWIVISLSICDLFMIIISAVHIIPATYLHEQFVPIHHTRTIWAMFAYNVFWYTGVVQLAAMAVNRFVSIVYPLQYKRVFSPRNTVLIICLLFLLGLLSSLPTLHECCYIIYNHYMYVTYYDPEDSPYMWLDIFLNSVSVLTMILCYTAILIRVRKSSMKRRKHQMVALAAKARRTSGTVLLTTAPLINASNNNSSFKQSNIPNGTSGKIHRERLQRRLSPLSRPQSSLSVDADKNDNWRNASTRSMKKPPFSRASSGSSFVGSFIRSQNRKQQPEQNNDTVSRLLMPQARIRRQAGAAGRQHRPSQQQQQQASRREIRLFVQFFVVSLVFLSTWVTWQWLPRIPNASKWIYFGTTTLFFINNAINPTVYLIFNSGLRHQVKNLFCPGDARKGAAARAAASAAAAMGGNQVTARHNSSSDESNQCQNRHNRSLKMRQTSTGYSFGDDVSEDMRTSNMALAVPAKDTPN